MRAFMALAFREISVVSGGRSRAAGRIRSERSDRDEIQFSLAAVEARTTEEPT